jgi:hypothetical protein
MLTSLKKAYGAEVTRSIQNSIYYINKENFLDHYIICQYQQQT